MLAPYNFKKLTLLLAVVIAIFFLSYKFKTYTNTFDDSYMFARYAKNIITHGNFGWNPQERTFGCTSIPFTLFVTAVYLTGVDHFISDGVILSACSFFWGIVALWLLYIIFGKLDKDSFYQPQENRALILLTIIFSPTFSNNLYTGMDATMSMAFNALLVLAYLNYLQAKTLLSLLLAAVCSYLSFLVRPDNGLYAVLIPLCMLWRNVPFKDIVLCGFMIGVLLVLDAGLKYLYFGYVLPLPFYVKSSGFYDGYLGVNLWNPFQYASTFLLAAVVPLIIFMLGATRASLLKALPYWIPLAITILYYFTVVQIMGHHSRYYLPSVVFLVVGCAAGTSVRVNLQYKKALLIFSIIPFLFLAADTGSTLYRYLKNKATAQSQRYRVYEKPGDLGWWNSIQFFNKLIKMVSDDEVIAASEHGFLACDNPSKEIMDLSGLHNNNIVAHIPLDVSLKEVAPGLLWMPHTDYSKLRFEIMNSPYFASHYDLYPEVLEYGLAIRKDLPQYPAILQEIKKQYGEQTQRWVQGNYVKR